MNQQAIPHSLQLQTGRRDILRMALPISMALLVPQLNFITNNIFIGGIGETELATAGITGVFYLVFALVGNGLNSGIQALIARRAGENRPREIGKLFAQSVWVSLLYALAGILVVYLFSGFFLKGVLSQVKVRDEAIAFMRIRIWGIPFLYLFQAGNALLVGTGNSRYMKYGFFVQSSLNILLDYLLIYGHAGFPALGFNGAALASVIAEALGMLVVFGIIGLKKMPARFSIFGQTRFNRPLAGLIFRQTSPLVLQWLLSVLSWLLFYILIEHTGERALAISNAMRNIYGLFSIFTWAFASTSNAMVSNIIGQGLKDEVIPLINRIMKISLVFTVVVCLLINIMPDVFLSIYGRDKSFSEEAIPVIRMVSGGILTMCMATVWLNGVIGTGNTKVNLLIEIIAIILYSAYIILVVQVWKLSLVWAWSAEVLYWISLLLMSCLYIRSGKWRNTVI